MLIESRFGFVSELSTRGTTPPLSPISGSSIEQRRYMKVHCTERGLNTLIESGRLFPVVSVWNLELKETSVRFTCSDDYNTSRQPRPLLQSSGVSLLTDQSRSGTQWMQANWQITVVGKASAGALPSQSTVVQEDGFTSSTDEAELVTDSTEVGLRDNEGVRVR